MPGTWNDTNNARLETLISDCEDPAPEAADSPQEATESPDPANSPAGPVAGL